MARTKVARQPTLADAAWGHQEGVEAMHREKIRRWENSHKNPVPVIVFPSREAKLAWLAEGARTGVTPPLPEGAYYEGAA